MTIRKFIKEQEKEALAKNKEESAVILLLCHVLQIETTALFLRLDEEITEAEITSFKKQFSLYLDENKPIQYIIGTSCFYGYDFIVNENVLIPRFETEELVENVLYRYDKYFKGQKLKVVDVATGSGCIGITLALEEKNLEVSATDISFEALQVAKENAQKLGAEVKFFQGDMLEPLTEKYDILVSNPPYIPEAEEVMSLVKDNEPNIALFGGADGLKFYEVILSGANRILNPRALIAFEHGYDKKNEIEAIARKYFPSARVETIKDLEGKDRMTFVYIGDFYE